MTCTGCQAPLTYYPLLTAGLVRAAPGTALYSLMRNIVDRGAGGAAAGVFMKRSQARPGETAVPEYHQT
jgi:hypothetical protein